MKPLEVWGGIECTIARIGDTYRDQFSETGHHHRPGDLDLIADLGIRTLRYPVLWEAIEGTVPGRGWAWHDERLDRLRELCIEPIVGLLHHGSGPLDTDLLDPNLPERLAEHARAVAERYPWVSQYTPVNEPLTTARFSALYGHWYPHRRSYQDFLRALVNQCRAIVLAMREIRRINPAAELVQTEDIGRVFSTKELAYQADHENERRWLSLDLLTGSVRPGHALWQHLLDSGIGQEELEAFWEVLPPDLIGINHYLTSDRYLDADLSRYPVALHGGNGRQAYADAEAVRVAELEGQTGPLARLREVAARYSVPLVVSEVHHGCTRDEQLRWLDEVWNAGLQARQEGIDLRAVTVWSLFGATDWNSVLTRRDGIYEPGVFDIRGGVPRPTALARATRDLASTGHFDHAALATPAWWRRPERLYVAPPVAPAIAIDRDPAILIRGEAGPLLDQWMRIADHRGLRMLHVDPRRHAPSIERPEGVWAVIETSMSAVPAFMSWLKLATEHGLPYVFISSSEVFEPSAGCARLEHDMPSPTSGSGRRGADREAAILARHPHALIVRAAPLFGPGTADERQTWMGEDAYGLDDLAGQFSYVPDLVHVTLDLLIDGETGIRHLPNGQPDLQDTFPESRATRLATARGPLMPPFESALARSGLGAA